MHNVTHTHTHTHTHPQAGHVCGDSYDLVDGHPTGSVRISFGYMSTLEDAENFVRFIEHCFVDQSLASDPKPLQPDDQSHSLTSNLESNAQIWISMELKRQDIIQNYAAVTTGNRLSGNEKAAVPSGAVISVGDLITVRQKDGMSLASMVYRVPSKRREAWDRG